jgi:anaphase-promoting complex subunit 1
VNLEWTAFVVAIFSLILGLTGALNPPQTRAQAKRKPRTGLLRSSSGAQDDLDSWEMMMTQEASNGAPYPSWSGNRGWKWLSDNDHAAGIKHSEISSAVFTASGEGKGSFIQEHIKLARDFADTISGQTVLSECLPSSGNDSERQKGALVDIFVGLHLLHEEQRLDTMTADSLSSGIVSLTPILAQIARWFGWDSWVAAYDVEDAALLEMDYDTDASAGFSIPEPFECPEIFSWIQICIATKNLAPFMTLPEVVNNRSPVSNTYTRDLDHWSRLTPRTLLFAKFFSAIRSDWTAPQFVEGLSTAGMDVLLLETLPEAVLAPLQEAIIQCQTQPPTTWSKDLLAIVGREDVNMILSPGQRSPYIVSTPLVRVYLQSTLHLLITS